MLSLVAGTWSIRTIVSPTRTPARSAGPRARSEITTKPCRDGSTLIPMPEYVDAVSCRTSL
jgi:hypothetical protein